MRLWVAPILFVVLAVILRVSVVRQRRREALQRERERWERLRAERGVVAGDPRVDEAYAGVAAELDEIMADWFTFDAARRWMAAEPPFEEKR